METRIIFTEIKTKRPIHRKPFLAAFWIGTLDDRNVTRRMKSALKNTFVRVLSVLEFIAIHFSIGGMYNIGR